MYKFLTPGVAPTETICIQLVIPKGEEWESLVRGAIAPLLSPDSFEQFGELTPDETAAFFEEFMRETWDWLECP